MRSPLKDLVYSEEQGQWGGRLAQGRAEGRGIRWGSGALTASGSK